MSKQATERGIPMVDMGFVHGEHTFYRHNRSIEELMEDGEIVAIPDPTQGIVYKRMVNATYLEKMAALTITEAKKLTAEWNARFKEQ